MLNFFEFEVKIYSPFLGGSIQPQHTVYQHRNWTLVSVPDTKTCFRSYTKCNATQLTLTMLSLSVAKQNTAKTLTNLAIFIQVVERRKQIEIEEQEIRRKEKELMSTVKLPAEAEAYKVQTIAEGKR